VKVTVKGTNSIASAAAAIPSVARLAHRGGYEPMAIEIRIAPAQSVGEVLGDDARVVLAVFAAQVRDCFSDPDEMTVVKEGC
jgi:hypothetical protein